MTKKLGTVLFVIFAVAWAGWCACHRWNKTLSHPTSDGGIELDDVSWIAPSIVVPITSGQ